jgi:hypothetical protein
VDESGEEGGEAMLTLRVVLKGAETTCRHARALGGSQARVTEARPTCHHARLGGGLRKGNDTELYCSRDRGFFLYNKNALMFKKMFHPTYEKAVNTLSCKGLGSRFVFGKY